MAIQLEEDKKKDQETAQAGTSGQTQMGAPGQSALTGSAVAPKGSSSGRFTNIQNFISANRQSGFGQNLAGRLGSVTKQAQDQTSKEKEAFQNKTSEAFKNYRGGREFGQQAIADPTKAAANAQDLARFQQISQGQYAGPQGLQNVDQLKSAAETAKQTTGLTGSEAGRQTLLQSFYSKPTYTQGQKSLDNLLLQADPTQMRALRASRAAATGANRFLNQAVQQSTAEALGKQQQAKAIGQELTGALGIETTARDKELEAKLSDISAKEAEQKALFDKTREGLAAGEIDEDTAIRLGLLKQGENDLSKFNINTYGADLTRALQTNLYGGPLTKEAIASQDEAARMNALAKLANKGQVFDPSQVAQYKASTQGFDQDILNRDIQRGQQDYQQKLAEVARLDQPFEQSRKFESLLGRVKAGDRVTQSEINDALAARNAAIQGASQYGHVEDVNTNVGDILRAAAGLSGGALDKSSALRQIGDISGRGYAGAGGGEAWSNLYNQQQALRDAAAALAGRQLRIKPKK